MFIKFNINVVIFSGAFISAILVYYAGNLYGPGLTFDSINYLYAGVSLAEKGKLMRPSQDSFNEWPPLYPVLIAALNTFSKNLLQSVFYFQIIIASITVGLTGKLAHQFIQNKFIFLTSYTAVVFSSPLLLINHFVWSEGFFVLLITLYIHFLTVLLKKPSKFVWIILILIGALICLQRHAGVFFVSGGVCIIYFSKKSTLSNLRKIWDGILFGLLSLIPLVGWWVYKYFKGDTFNNYSFIFLRKTHLQHFLDFNYVFTSWFLPQQFPVWIRIILVYTIIGFLLFFYRKAEKSEETIFLKAEPHLIVLSSLFFNYFILLYLSTNGIDILDDRILAPVYIPGILLFFSLLDGYIHTIHKPRRNWILFAFILWTLYPVTRAIHNVHFWHNVPVQPPAEQPVEAEFYQKLKF